MNKVTKSNSCLRPFVDAVRSIPKTVRLITSRKEKPHPFDTAYEKLTNAKFQNKGCKLTAEEAGAVYVNLTTMIRR